MKRVWRRQVGTGIIGGYMRQAVRAVVVKSGKMLVMKRNKFGQVYYTLIGGRIELNETPEQALVRELGEEAGMTAKTARLIFIEKAGDPFGDQLIYLCDGVEGDPVLSPDSEEAHINALGKNLYEPMWLPINELASVPFRSEVLKRKLLQGFASNFPESAETFDPGNYHA